MHKKQQEVDDKRDLIKDGAKLQLFPVAPTKHYPVLSVKAVMADIEWSLKAGVHVMRSWTDSFEPTYIFSSVMPGSPDVFYCAVLAKGGWASRVCGGRVCVCVAAAQ
jgi:hypothetical protein